MELDCGAMHANRLVKLIFK